MITDRIFISYSNSEEGRKAISKLTVELSNIKRTFHFFRENEKSSYVNGLNQEKLILDRVSKCGVTVFVLSSDFFSTNKHLLKKKPKGQTGWNYEELKTSLLWNQTKMNNSVIVTYTEEFFFKYLKNSDLLLEFPIIHKNIGNLNTLRAADVDSKNYLEIISLDEFLSNSKLYLNKVDKRKIKHSTTGLYNIYF
ncbi:MAG: hypothetical protein ACRC1F_03155 [Metamycoplasmataceae bacterium]